MSYRGVYRDGFVELHGDVDLRNGDRVQVFAAGRLADAALKRRPLERLGSSRKRGVTAWEELTRVKMSRRQRIAAALAACGTWKNRAGWKGKSSANVAAELRVRASRRGRNG